MGVISNDGGKLNIHPCNYDDPKGPKGMYREGPGLGGENTGVGNRPTGVGGESGSPGLGGTNHGNNPSRN